MTEKSATVAMDALKELFMLTQPNTVQVMFARLVEKIRVKDHGYFVVNVAYKFIQSFLMKGYLHVSTVLSRPEGEPTLVSILIEELEDYMSFVKAEVHKMLAEADQAGTKVELSKLSDRCF